MPDRLLKVNENIQRELSIILNEEPVVEDGLITITYVLTTPDLREATIGMSILNHPKPDTVIELLNQRSSLYYALLSDRTRMKYVPKLIFEVDKQTENIERIDEIIDTLHSDDKDQQ